MIGSFDRVTVSFVAILECAATSALFVACLFRVWIAEPEVTREFLSSSQFPCYSFKSLQMP